MANVTEVDYNNFVKLKQSFFRKHNSDFQTTTSPMDDLGVYYKTYCFRDGTSWFERMSPEYIQTNLTVKGISIPMHVKLLKTEFWNSENAFSKYYYELFNHSILQNGVVI